MDRNTFAIGWVMAGAIALSSVTSGQVVHDHGHDHDHDHGPATQPVHRTPRLTLPGKNAHGHDDHAGHGHDEHGHDDHGHHADEVRLTDEAIRRHGIRVERVEKQVLSATFIAPARVSFNAEAMAHVGSTLSGRVVELKAKLGDMVAKGDELLVIESADLAEAQSEYLLKRAEAEVVRLAVEPAKQAYERAKGLYDSSKGVALAEVQKREAEWRSAEATHASAVAAATAAENRLQIAGMSAGQIETLAKTGKINPRMPIVAPIAGQVVQREVTLGEGIGPEKDALMVLADLTTLWVLADVPEARLGGVTRGTRATVRTGTGGEAISGEVTYVAPSVNPETRSASVRIEVTGNGVLRPGMFARAEIRPRTGNGEAVLAVPEEAVQTVEGSPAVFVPVANEPNRFARRAVEIGRPVGGMVPVTKGLAEGEAVVVSGSFILKAELGKAGASHGH
jgi:cobalt-zinc-cadmium efflux system membrane fusion protein